MDFSVSSTVVEKNMGIESKKTILKIRIAKWGIFLYTVLGLGIKMWSQLEGVTSLCVYQNRSAKKN